MSYKPDKVLIDASVASLPICQEILSRIPGVETHVIDATDDDQRLLSDYSSITSGKKILRLKRYPGNPFKLCPGFDERVLCCSYYVIDLVENCALECSYCILQAFLNRPGIIFHVNVEEVVQNTIAAIQKEPKRQFRVGTGEHSDSLALDDLFGVNAKLVSAFADVPNATLELKTKTDKVEPLMGLKHNGRTVIAWSLNPPEIIQANELKTASLERRLSAAARVVADGYKVAFHFDPIIHYPDWRNGYQKTVQRLFERINPDAIAWISLGTLRYIPSLKQIAEERFPKVSIFCGEFIKAEDGKMKYLKVIRKELLQSLSRWIQERGPNVPLYFCMEKQSLWRSTFAQYPTCPGDLETYLNQNVYD